MDKSDVINIQLQAGGEGTDEEVINFLLARVNRITHKLGAVTKIAWKWKYSTNKRVRRRGNELVEVLNAPAVEGQKEYECPGSPLTMTRPTAGVEAEQCSCGDPTCPKPEQDRNAERQLTGDDHEAQD